MAQFFDAGRLMIVSFVSLLLLSVRVSTEPTRDKQALLAFISQTPHANRVQWNASVSACTWFGVQCDASRSFVYFLRLPGAGLLGGIPPNTIARLTQLRVLSLRSNGLTGEIPADFSNLTLLRNVYLQGNQFSGEFPTVLTQLTRLTRLDLSSNKFTGSIPFSINKLTHLTGIFLENNGFTGNLPSITAKLVDFNVSHNQLNGSIPESLSNFPASSFARNLGLCGGPLPPCNPFFPAPIPSPSSPVVPSSPAHKKLSKAAIIAIAVGCSLAALLLLLLFLLLCLGKRRRSQQAKPPKPVAATRSVPAEAGTSSSKDDITGGSVEAERNKLVFFEGGIYSFDLEDLLRASAEVLGKGSAGTSYKAVLEEGTTVVVKRLKDVAVTKKDFDTQMEVLGKIKHENVVPLRAYYYSKDEKLLVYDYFPSGSLSALLHGTIFMNLHFNYWLIELVILILIFKS